MIAGARAAKTPLMGVKMLSAWFEANREGLVVGLAAAAALVAIMLVLRSYGERTIRRHPR